MASGLTSLKYFDDVPIALECVVGDSLNCVVAFSASQTTTLSRRPAGSSASVSSNTFSPDTPGLYVVTLGFSEGPSVVRNFIAYPASILSRRLRNGKKVDRAMLRALSNSPRLVSGAGLQANIAASLEAPGSGSPDGVDGRMFGGGTNALNIEDFGEGTG